LRLDRSKFDLKTLLWDIDGTLLTTRGAGAKPFKETIEGFLGLQIEFNVKDMAGLTDHQIVALHLRQAGFVDLSEELISKLVLEYASKLQKTFDVSPVIPFPGILELLEILHRLENYELAIVTGNCFCGAQEKLSSAGLSKFFDEEKIFCSVDSGPRSYILQRALSTLNTSSSSSIVIGDTIHDWNAAKDLDIPFILVVNEGSPNFDMKNTPRSISLGPSWSPQEFIRILNEL
jgi:phosphoglycolate phosphatase